MKTSVLNIAQWFLCKESMTHKKLQKLCYYAQAWHLALLNEPLFADEIQAWIHGPVIPALYARYADYGWNEIPKAESSDLVFPEKTLQVLETVWNTYKGLDGDQLESLTHSEGPWIEARNGIPSYLPCTNSITCESMSTFYKRIWQEAQND